MKPGARKLFLIGLLLNVVLLSFVAWKERDVRHGLPLLSPRIFVQNPNDIIINFTDLREELRSVVSEEKSFHAGVYFEYLPTGVSIGIYSFDLII